LQEQVHDLNQELGDALGHIEMLQEQQMLPLIPNKPEPNPQLNHSSSGSQSSVGNLDDFWFIFVVDILDVFSVP
jgi:hypothetical protein